MTRPHSALRHLALQGEVDGIRRTYLLQPGINRIGRGVGGEVVLTFEGISRRHALLSVEPHRLVLEDLGSKNGTFANGERVESQRIEVGDRLRFGPVALRLEELPEHDLEIASRTPIAHTSSEAPPTTLAFAGDIPALWESSLAWFDALLPPAHDPSAWGTPWLERLVERLQAAGAAWLFREADGSLVVDALVGVPPSEAALHAALTKQEDISQGRPSRSTNDVLAVAHELGQGRCRALAIWGSFPARARSAPLLALLLRLAPSATSIPSTALRQPSQTAVRTKKLTIPDGWIPGDSPAMRALLRQIQAIATSDLPILILGETGVGKEGVARILHGSSARARGPFIATNCAAIPRDLLEAELFGVGRGVATGVSPRPGKVLAAHGGTLLLDEIGELPLELQAKLLRFLQEREIQPLGSAPVAVDVRVLAATNVHLDERVREGSFRADLYYRLAGYALRVPPLRERREDIPALVEHFLANAAQTAGRSIAGLTVGALAKLVEHAWPGNVRELEHEVQKLVWFAAESEVIVAERIRLDGFVAETPRAREQSEPDSAPTSTLSQFSDADLELDTLERRAIQEALRRAGGNQSRAAEILGITRTALYRRIQRFGLATEIG